MRVLFALFYFLSLLSAEEAFVNVDGDLRFTYVDYRYDNNFFPNSNASVLSAKLSLTTKKYNNLYAKASMTGVQGINHDPNKQSMTYIFSNTWNGENHSYSLLEELYIGYESDLISLKVGAQEMATPYIDSDDYFVTPNSFEAITLKLRPTDNIIFDIGYVDKMSGSWDSSYDGSDFHSMSRQAWIHYSDGSKDTYPVDGVYNIVGDQGISYGGLTYKNDTHKIQLWDFYAHEMFNTIMAQYDYSGEVINAAIQYSAKRDVGKLKDSPTYRVNYDVYGLKIAYKVNKEWNLTTAYTGISDDDSLHFFGSWGGFPEFASGMAVSYFETYLRDTNIYALASAHNLSSILNGLNLTMKYAYYDLNSDYTINTNKNTPNGDGYMHAYGLTTSYVHNKQLGIKVILAGRELESGNKSQIFRAILKYSF